MKDFDHIPFYRYDDEYIDKISRKCKCGHIQIVDTRERYKKCRFCGRIVFLDKKAEFNYKVKRRYGL